MEQSVSLAEIAQQLSGEEGLQEEGVGGET
jgi:hypothetical protein